MNTSCLFMEIYSTHEVDHPQVKDEIGEQVFEESSLVGSSLAKRTVGADLNAQAHCKDKSPDC